MLSGLFKKAAVAGATYVGTQIAKRAAVAAAAAAAPVVIGAAAVGVAGVVAVIGARKLNKYMNEQAEGAAPAQPEATPPAAPAVQPEATAEEAPKPRRRRSSKKPGADLE